MNIAIVGVGAVGGVMASMLIEAGHEVSLIARGEALRAIRERGLVIQRGPDVSLMGGVAQQAGRVLTYRPPAVTDRPVDVGPQDLVIIATKAYQVSDAAKATVPMIGPTTIVLPVQNGLEAPITAAGIVDGERVLAGIASMSSALAAPGHVLLRGDGMGIRVAEMDDRRTERLDRVVALFKTAGMGADVPDSIQAALWGKLIANGAKGTIGALTRQPVGGWRDAPETVALFRGLMEESVAVAASEGVRLPGYLEGNLGWLPRDDPSFTTSMQRGPDRRCRLRAGRPGGCRPQAGPRCRHSHAAPGDGVCLPAARRTPGEGPGLSQ